MIAQKKGWPSFSSIISILSIVLYCTGFLRVELELNEQKKRINALENVAETKATADVTDIIKSLTTGSEYQASKLQRNRRHADSAKNATDDEQAAEHMLKSNKLLAELRLNLCGSKVGTCLSGPPGPPGAPGPMGEKGSRGRRGQKGRIGNKGDMGIMGSPGKSGKQGIMGSVGPQGETGAKGQKGDTGSAGIPGAKGEPGESISVPVVAVSPAKLTVNETGTALFQCSFSGNPEPAIKWSKLEEQTEKSQSVSGRMLLLKRVTGHDSGVYKCSATNILGKAEALVQLVVNVRPRVSLHPGPRHAIEGSKFTFPTCHVTGHPQPVVTWRKLSGQLSQWRTRHNNSALQILHVRKRDSDAYFCSAANLLGSVEKKTLLFVVSLPRFTFREPAKIVAKHGSTLTLSCSAIGDPKPVISWKKQGGQLPVGRSQQNSGALVIRDLQTNDAGNYICAATSGGLVDAETATYIEVQKGIVHASTILSGLNSKYLEKLNSYIVPVLQNSSRSGFVRCWHAKTDGWAASTFHSNCDGKGPTVTIIKASSYIFGGYTDVSWFSSGGYASSSKSFIYSLYNINGYAPVKLQIKTGRHRYAINRYSNYGPTFGGGNDIRIYNNAASNRNSYTDCGHTYPLPPGYSSSGSPCTFYAGSYHFTPTDVEVFYETTT